MKRILLIAAIAALSMLSLSARNYPLRDFTSLDISSIYEVTVEKSNTYSVEVEASPDMEPYLDVRIRGSVLVLDVNNHRTLVAKKNSYIKAHICMPELVSLELSGMAQFSTEDKFTTKGKFYIEASGATGISKLSIDADVINIDQSGVSKLKEIKLNADKLDLEVSGTGQFDATGWVETANLDLSGASKVNYMVKSEDVEIELSGASKTMMDASSLSRLNVDLGGTSGLDLTSGRLEYLFVDASGASVFNGQTAVAKEVKVEASGASKVNVAVSEYLTVEASGASLVTYIEEGKLKLNNVRTSGPSTAVKIR